jgi:hypothetical protein
MLELLVREGLRKQPVLRSRSRWKCNIKIDIAEMDL